MRLKKENKKKEQRKATKEDETNPPKPKNSSIPFNTAQ